MNYLKSLVAALAIATVTSVAVAPAMAQAPPPTALATIGNLALDHVAGELVVGFAPSSSPAQMRTALDHSDVTLAQDLAVPRTKLVENRTGRLSGSGDGHASLGLLGA